MDYAYYDGKFLARSEVRFYPDERSFLFGDAIYDAMIGKGDRIYLLCEHMERFLGNARALSLSLSQGRDEIENILRALLRQITDGYAFLYLQAGRCLPERVHSSRGHSKSRLYAYAKSFELPSADKPISLVTVEDKRYGYCHIKTVNLLPNVLASAYADEMGADEAVFIHDGRVRECSHSNISILSGNTLITHPLDTHVLPGIMRAQLLRHAEAMGIEIAQRPFTLEELYRADGVLVTSTTKRCVLAEKINREPLKPPSTLAKNLHENVNSSFFSAMEKCV